MLSAAGIALALTALLAGFTGSWSPCGLSSVETIGSGLGRNPSRATRGITLGIFSLCCVVGGGATFGSVSWLGGAIGLSADSLVVALSASLIAAIAGTADLRFLPIVPQVRNQVPERIRHRLPLPATSALYGLMLGLGFTTYLLTWAMWALLIACLLIGTPWLGLAVGIAFGIGRALPVVVLAGRFERDTSQQFIHDMETGPLLKGLRRIDGVALIACALLIVPVATADAARLPGLAADPSADDAAGTTFNKHLGAGFLLRPRGDLVPLPGSDPAIGGGLVAWHNGDLVTVANAFSLVPVAEYDSPGVNALALDGRFLAFRATDSSGRDSIGIRDLADGARHTISSPDRPATLSPPAISDGRLVFGVWGHGSTRIVSVAANGDGRRNERTDGPSKVVSNPSVHVNSLIYVRSTYCNQALMLGHLGGRRSGRGDRVLLRLRATAARDNGYESHHIHAYNGASRCHGHRFARYRGTLWTTGLSKSRALVTLLGSNRSRPHVLTIAR
jgi:hypothetical protein